MSLHYTDTDTKILHQVHALWPALLNPIWEQIYQIVESLNEADHGNIQAQQHIDGCMYEISRYFEEVSVR